MLASTERSSPEHAQPGERDLQALVRPGHPGREEQNRPKRAPPKHVRAAERLHASATRPAANRFLAFEGAIQKLGDHASISTTMTVSHLSPTTLALSMACQVADVISQISKLRDGT